jgi:hypothetical protein
VSTVTMEMVRVAMCEDLKRSGLTEKMIFAEPRLVDLKNRRRPGYLIRYPDFSTGRPNGYARYRYLPELNSGWEKTSAGEQRYDQPAKTDPHIFFPKGTDWEALLTDAAQPLYLTEGEKKAAAGVQAGYPVMGMGGAYNYKPKNHEQLIPELAAFVWKGRRAYLIYDSDTARNAQVMDAADRLAALLAEQGAAPYVIVLPDRAPEGKTGLDDFLLAEGREGFAKLIEQAEPWQAANRILRSDLLSRAVTKAERILAADPTHKLFVHGNELVRVVEQAAPAKDDAEIRRPEGSTYLAPMTAANLAMILSASGRVFKNVVDERKQKQAVPADPKDEWCQQMVGNVRGFPDRVPWKHLRLVTHTPLVLADGGLVCEPGYHAPTAVWFDPRGRQFPTIAARPTRAQARKALDQFAAVYEKFPFAQTEAGQRWDDTPSYAAVLATILSVLIRHLLPTVPMLGISAPEAGTGKTKIAESAAAAATGSLPTRISYDDTEEFEKVLPVVLRAGERTVLVDNVVKTISSPKLAQILTTDEPVDFRVLGESRSVKTPNRSVIMATGNHLIISSDLPRRSLLCTLNPNAEQPETRAFAFDPVERARELFPKLVTAALTALRYYFQQGSPQPQYAAHRSPLQSGSFERWNQCVRSLLVHLGFADPLATQQQVRESDTWRQNDVALLESLHKLFPREPFTTAQIRSSIGSDAFTLLCSDDEGKWNAVRAGLRLLRLRDRVLGGLSLRGAGHLHGVAKFIVVCDRKNNCETCRLTEKIR